MTEPEGREAFGSASGQAAMPSGVRGAVLSAVALFVVAALYLLAVRGDALLLDLSALGKLIFCL